MSTHLNLDFFIFSCAHSKQKSPCPARVRTSTPGISVSFLRRTAAISSLERSLSLIGLSAIRSSPVLEPLARHVEPPMNATVFLISGTSCSTMASIFRKLLFKNQAVCLRPSPQKPLLHFHLSWALVQLLPRELKRLPRSIKNALPNVNIL